MKKYSIYIFMLVSALLCGAVSYISSSALKNVILCIIVTVLAAIVCSLATFTVYLAGNLPSKKDSVFEEWQDLIFFWENHEINDTNREFAEIYINSIIDGTKHPYTLTKKINHLLTQNGFGNKCFSLWTVYETHVKALGHAIAAFGWCLLLFALFTTFNSQAYLQGIVYVSIILSIVGFIACRLCAECVKSTWLLPIIGILLAIIVIPATNYKNEHIEKYTDVSGESIVITEIETDASVEVDALVKESSTYAKAYALYVEGNYSEAIILFSSVIDYKDSRNMIIQCEAAIAQAEQIAEEEALLEGKYLEAKSLYESNEHLAAYIIFSEIPDYKDSTKYLIDIAKQYKELARKQAGEGRYQEAYDTLASFGYTTDGTSNHSSLMSACKQALNGNYKPMISEGFSRIILLDNTTVIGSGAFENCTGLVELVMPDTVITIGDYAFSGCTSLSSLVLSDNLTKVGRAAFANCDALEKLVLPASLESIDIYRLNSIAGEIHFEGTVDQWKIIAKNPFGVSLDKTIYCSDGNING